MIDNDMRLCSTCNGHGFTGCGECLGYGLMVRRIERIIDVDEEHIPRDDGSIEILVRRTTRDETHWEPYYSPNLIPR